MRLLYYKHPALVKPSLPALKRSALSSPATSCGLLEKTPPYVQKLRALPVQGVTSVMKMAPSSGKRMACAPHCFFPAHRMYAPPLAAPKGPSARFESAS